MTTVAAPNLPLATKEYSSQYIDQLNNVLRLYFNQLSNAQGLVDTQSNSNQALIWLDM